MSRERLFVDYPKIPVTSSHCYVVMHPGYWWHHYKDVAESTERFPEKYGNYLEYRENMSSFIQSLSGELSIFALEEAVFYNMDMLDQFKPPESALILVTKNHTLDFKSHIIVEGDEMVQREDLMRKFLHDNGIEEIRLAGEVAWYWSNRVGCLTGVAEYFLSHDFGIKGVENCIFPLKSRPWKHWDKLTDEVLKKLYRVL